MSDILRWTPKNLDSSTGERHSMRLPTAEELERVHHDAHSEGYEAGFREGMAAGYKTGEAQAREEAQRLAELSQSFDAAIRNLEQELGRDLLALALDISKQMLRHALRVKPELLLPVVRSAMESLPQNVQHPHIHLNPEDLVLVRDAIGSELAHAGWRLVDDPRIARGGCLIETSAAEVDASLPSRWQRIATALGQNNAWLDEGD